MRHSDWTTYYGPSESLSRDGAENDPKIFMVQQLPNFSAFSKPLEFLRTVKYGGAVGKQAVIVIVALFMLGFLGLCAIWIKVVALAISAMVLVLVVVGLFAIQKTLKNYPQQSMMEGTDIIKYRQQEIEIGTKEIRKPPPKPQRSISEPGEHPQLPPGDNPEEPDQ